MEELRIDELGVGGLTLRGVSMGGTHTCIMCPELRVMFDIGQRTPGQLKFDTLLVSHGHQDHLGAVTQLVSTRRMLGLAPLHLHVPEEIVAPLRTIFAAWEEIEGCSLDVDVVGHAPGSTATLRRGLAAVALRSVHRVPSLAWILERTTPRLRAEYRGLGGEALAQLRASGVTVTEQHTEPVLCVTGDTQIELFDEQPRLRTCRVLVHEVTGWDQRRSVAEVRQWGHTHVDEMIPRAEAFEGEALVLVHRSPRHSREQAERVVRERFPASVRDKVHVFGC